MRKLIAAAAACIAIAGLSGCSKDADVASKNISTDADNFKVARRVVFINGITDSPILEIRGFCSLGNDRTATEISVTCKVDGGFKKHFLGISDNTTYLIEQLDAAKVSTSFYKVIIKPSTIVPDFEIR
jgi:hypothetical protein